MKTSNLNHSTQPFCNSIARAMCLPHDMITDANYLTEVSTKSVNMYWPKRAGGSGLVVVMCSDSDIFYSGMQWQTSEGYRG